MQRVGLLTEVSGHLVWGGGTDRCGWTEPGVWGGKVTENCPDTWLSAPPSPRCQLRLCLETSPA